MRTNRTRQKGFVVIIVLCMVVLLSVLLLAFNQESRANLQNVEDFRKSFQALNCARTGLNFAIAAAKNTTDVRFDKSINSFFSGEKIIKLDQGQCTISISEEAGKINVNLLKELNGKLNRMLIDHFLRLIDKVNLKRSGDFRVDYSIVPAIIDWIDIDDQVTTLSFVEHRNKGAETATYGLSTDSIQCRNAPIDSIDELINVKGMSTEVFECLRDYLTVYGDGLINLNSASELVLASLSEQMDTTLARVIIDRRNLKPFESVVELRNVPGMTDSLYLEISRMLTVESSGRYFNVTSRGEVDGLNRTITAIIRVNEDTNRIDIVLYRELT